MGIPNELQTYGYKGKSLNAKENNVDGDLVQWFDEHYYNVNVRNYSQD